MFGSLIKNEYHTMFKTRRDFIRKTAMGAALAISIPEIVSAALAGTGSPAKKLAFNANDVILFQGDSITDAGRDKERQRPNDTRALGTGYPLLATGELLVKYASQNLSIYNKGISGNKVYQLAERWDNDCLNLKPNVLSILIGVNDYWHTLASKDKKYSGTVQTYRDDYRALLDRTLKQLPGVKLVIGEPFGVKGLSAVTDEWYPGFDAYRAVAKEIATDYKAAFVPYQQVFDEAVKLAPPVYWTADGVHPSLAGAQLMAEAWMKSSGY